MIRVYLDWNAISHLGREENRLLLEYLYSVQEEVLFPASHAHIIDLLKGGREDNPNYQTDLLRLKKLCNNHFFTIDKNQVTIHIDDIEKLADSFYEARIDIIDFDFNTIVDTLDGFSDEFGIDKVGSLFKEHFKNQAVDIPIDDKSKRIVSHIMPGLFDSENMWDFVQKMGPMLVTMLGDSENYKKFTKDLRDTGYSVSHMIGEWNTDDVISNIDSFMSKYKHDLTFNKTINIGLKEENGKYNLYEHYQTSYLQLGLIGYRQDKMKNKNDNWWNILADIEHSFLGGLCDVIVSSDARMVDKTKVLYKHYNCPVDIIKLDELQSYLQSKLEPYKKLYPSNIVSDFEYMIEMGELVEEFEPTNDIPGYTRAYKIPVRYLNYFTHLIKIEYKDKTGIVYTLRRVNENFNKYTFYTEAKEMVRRVEEVFGVKFKEEDSQKFIYSRDFNFLDILFENSIVRLESEEDFGYRPSLSLIISNTNIA